MKPKYLFMFKPLECQFILCIAGISSFIPILLKMADGLNVQDPSYHLPPDIDKMLYGYSMTISAFLSLLLKLPKFDTEKGRFCCNRDGSVCSERFFLFSTKGLVPWRRIPLSMNFIFASNGFCPFCCGL